MVVVTRRKSIASVLPTVGPPNHLATRILADLAVAILVAQVMIDQSLIKR